MSAMELALGLAIIKKEGKMGDFLEFLKEEIEKDGLEDDENIMGFYNDLCKLEEKEIIADVVEKVTGCEVQMFSEEDSILIENEVIEDDEVDRICNEVDPKINLKNINNALETKGYKLEFNSAYNFGGRGKSVGLVDNFLKFDIVKL